MNRIGTLALAVAQKLGVVKIYQNPSLLLLEYKEPPIYWDEKVCRGANGIPANSLVTGGSKLVIAGEPCGELH